MGQSLDLPGILVAEKSSKNPSLFGEELIKAMSFQKFNHPEWHGGESRRTYIPKNLNNCTHVLIRQDAIHKSLTPCYNGPFKVLKRQAKFFKLEHQGNVAVDRLIPFNGPVFN